MCSYGHMSILYIWPSSILAQETKVQIMLIMFYSVEFITKVRSTWRRQQKQHMVCLRAQIVVVIDWSLISNSPPCLLSHSILKPIVSTRFSLLTTFSWWNLSPHLTQYFILSSAHAIRVWLMPSKIICKMHNFHNMYQWL